MSAWSCPASSRPRASRQPSCARKPSPAGSSPGPRRSPRRSTKPVPAASPSAMSRAPTLSPRSSASSLRAWSGACSPAPPPRTSRPAPRAKGILAPHLPDSLRARWGAWTRSLGGRRVPTWLLGAIVALLGWKVAMNPPSVGLDSSWNGGLAMALENGLQWGRDIVFTYGPLGFMNGQGLWYSDLGVIAFAYGSTLYIAFCIALVWALRRLVPALPAVVIAFLVVTVLPLVEQSIVVAVLVCMRALEGDRSERTVNALVVAGASFAAVQGLVKRSAGAALASLFPSA